jgi:hypothetical protein
MTWCKARKPLVYILVKFGKQDLVLVQESGAEERVRLQHNMKMCKNRIKKSMKVTELLSDISLEVAENIVNSKESLR